MRILSFNNLKIHGALLILQIVTLAMLIDKGGLILPNFMSMLIFFFSILEETRPNYFFLMFFGLAVDAYCAPIIGATSLGYILISLVASSNKKALSGQKFNIVWAAFILSIAISELAKFLIYMPFKYTPNIQIAFIGFLLNIAVYPIIHYITVRKHHWFRIDA